MERTQMRTSLLKDWYEQRLESMEHLASFAEGAWHIIEPATPFIGGFHIDAICEHLEAVVYGQIKNLLVNIPPRHMKSTLINVLFPAWVWLRVPERRFIFGSYGQDLTVRDSVKCRQVIESDWYKQTFDIKWRLAEDQNAKSRFKNTKQGERISTSVGGKGTGEGADIIVADDPHNAKEIHSEVKRKSVIEWWDQVISTRANNPKDFSRIVVMQRLHEEDLSGHLLEKGGYEHLCLPAEYNGSKSVTVIGWSDPRKVEGEFLWPERFGKPEIDQLKKDLGPTAAAGQLQQTPSPAKGIIVQRDHFKFWTEKPARVDAVCQSWDMTFTAGDGTDYVVGAVLARCGPNYFLFDQVRKKMTFNQSRAAFLKMCADYPEATAKYIELAANGWAIAESLQLEVSGIIGIKPTDSKMTRALAVTPLIEAGNFYVPDPTMFPWVEAYLEEWLKFPNAKHDDQIDATTQGLAKLREIPIFDWVDESPTKGSIWRS